VKTRKFFKHFEPYEWETPTEAIASSIRIDPKDIFRLDTNTSPFIPVKPLYELSQKLPRMAVNQYPDTSYLKIRRALSTYCRINEDRFVMTNGADEGLDIIAKTFLDPGEEAAIISPTYSMFRIMTQIMDGKLISIKRRTDFSVDTHQVIKRTKNKTKLIFLCSPNNPTGNVMPLEDVSLLAEESKAIIAIDEAYYEFCGKSAIGLTDRHENMIIVRTFSKAFSMAGVRVGYLVASKPTIDELNKVRPPNSLSNISLELAQMALQNVESMKENVALIVSERERCLQALREIKELEAYPSDANFILFKVKNMDANLVHSRLLKKGFVLRNLANVPLVENCLRVTICTPEINGAFLDALKYVL
jgi:histidinol-phosphate aminotransferase